MLCRGAPLASGKVQLHCVYMAGRALDRVVFRRWAEQPGKKLPPLFFIWKRQGYFCFCCLIRLTLSVNGEEGVCGCGCVVLNAGRGWACSQSIRPQEIAGPPLPLWLFAVSDPTTIKIVCLFSLLGLAKRKSWCSCPQARVRILPRLVPACNQRTKPNKFLFFKGKVWWNV